MASHAVRAVGVVGALVLLLGCGADRAAPSTPRTSRPAFEDLTGRQIAAQASADLEKAGSIHLEGVDDYDGSRSRLDLAVDDHGNCVGSIELRRSSFEVVHTRERGWFLHGSAGYWKRWGPPKHRAEAAERFADRWLHIDGAELSRGLKQICDLDWVRTKIIPGDVDECVKTVGGPATTEPTVQVWCGRTHVWVSASEPHRPVKYESRDGREKVGVGGYDEPVDHALPRDEDILDLTDSELV